MDNSVSLSNLFNMKINYLDQIRITDKFQNLDQIKAIKPRIVEAVGYLVKETEDGVYMASIIVGKVFRGVLYIPAKAIVDRDDAFNGVEVEYVEAVGKDKMDKISLENLTQPPTIKLCGFLAHETDDLIYIAQEKNGDGNFRGIVAIPKKYLIK